MQIRAMWNKTVKLTATSIYCLSPSDTLTSINCQILSKKIMLKRNKRSKRQGEMQYKMKESIITFS